jgi:aryl-alcohol dehydrogenase-like predicted oxidoreductase
LALKNRPFGATGIVVSEIGFGTAGLGALFGRQSRPQQLHTLQRALDLGINFYDTADMYCQGESERLIGAAFHQRRDQVVIATKVGYQLPAQRRFMSTVKPVVRPLVRRLGLKREQLPPGVRGSLSQNFSPEYILRAAEQSLKRLNTEYIDVYQLHSPPRAVLESGDFLEPLDRLKRQGKIRHFGISCETNEDALIGLRHQELSALQLRLNLLDQTAVHQVIPEAAKRGLAIIARECFAGGRLFEPVDAVYLTAAARGTLEGQIAGGPAAAYPAPAPVDSSSQPKRALRFVLGIDEVSVAILGMSSEDHLMANLSYL